MQESATTVVWVIAAGSTVLFLFAVITIAVLLSSHRKVSETQQARLAEVQESEKRYKDLFNHSLAGMMKFFPDTWEIVDANDALLELFGCRSRDELQECFRLIPPGDVRLIQTSLTAQGMLVGHEIRMSRHDGLALWILFSATKVENEGNAHGVVVDITRKKETEETIEEQAALLDEAQDAIMAADETGIITFWNTGAEQTYGWTRKETVGRSLRKILFHDSKQEEYRLTMEDVLSVGEWSGEQHHRTRNGINILVQSSWKRITKGETGRNAILVVNTDITEKKRLESAFIRARRMESIALLTGGIAHDLHNILAPVSMSIGLLKEKLSDPSSLAVLKAVEESAQSGLDLVRNILMVGHGVAGERTRLDLSAVVDQALQIAGQGLSESIRIVRTSNGAMTTVEGDVSQLKQVFLNIALNARDAMPGGGTISVELSNAVVGDEEIDRFPEAARGPHVLVTLADSGVGMDEDVRERIFEPFFTSKGETGGTGLGLAVALGIVQSHGGFITVDSTVGKGSTFRVYLPSAREDEQ